MTSVALALSLESSDATLSSERNRRSQDYGQFHKTVSPRTLWTTHIISTIWFSSSEAF